MIKRVNNRFCEHFSKAETRVEAGRPDETLIDTNMQYQGGALRQIKAPVKKTIAENLR